MGPDAFGEEQKLSSSGQWTLTESQQDRSKPSSEKRRRNHPAFIAAGIALGLAVVASGFFILSPCVVQGSRSSTTLDPGSPAITTQETYCESFVESAGPGVLILLGFPVLISLVGFLATWWNLRLIVGLMAMILQLFWLATGFSIGLLYLPAAMAMMVAAVLAFVVRSDRPPDVTHAPDEGAQDFDAIPDRS